MTKNMSAAQPRRQGEQPCRDVHGLSVGKWEAFGLLKDMTCHYGLNSSDLLLLEKHLAVVPDVGAPAPVRVSFQSQTAVCRAANGMTERTARRCEAKLEELGFLKRQRSGNGRRYPDRHAETGKIVGGYGIDLQPFFDRIPEIVEEHQAQQVAHRERASAFSQVSALLSELKRLSMDNSEVITKLQRAYHNLRRRASAGMDEIMGLVASVKAALRTSETEAPCPALSVPAASNGGSASSVADTSAPSSNEPPAPSEPAATETELNTGHSVASKATQPAMRTAEKLPADNLNTADQTTLPHQTQTAKMTAAAGQNVRRKESYNTKDSNHASSELSVAETWARCPSLREFFLEAPRSDMDVIRIAYDACRFFGIRQDAITKCLAGFGSSNLLLILDYLTPKAAELTNPGAYLASMLRKFDAGEAVAGGRVRARAKRRTVVSEQRSNWSDAGIHHAGAIG